MSKLNLDKNLINKARAHAKNIARDTQNFIDKHTTVTVERTVCRLLGIDGVNALENPLPNVVVEHLLDKNILSGGSAYYVGNAICNLGLSPQQIAEGIDKGEIDLSTLPRKDITEVRKALALYVDNTINKIDGNVKARQSYLDRFGDKQGAYLYIIVATGNIYEDIVQAKAAAKQGADIIDIGAESSRPGAVYIKEQDEIKALIPIIKKYFYSVVLLKNIPILYEKLNFIKHHIRKIADSYILTQTIASELYIVK